MKRRLLWSGDACCATGFARTTHKTLETLCNTWDVIVLGIGANGDPHEFPYTVYPAFTGGDAFGVGRIASIVRSVKPDVVVIQNDPWNIPPFINELRHATVSPIVGIIAVDGRNCRGTQLNGLNHAIFWTAFAEDEAKEGGYTGPSTVVPLGIDLDVYHPLDRAEARRALDLTKGSFPPDAFIVGNVNRNQPRKRLDLTIACFAAWIKSRHVDDAYLFLHVCPTGEHGCDVRQLVRYFGIQNRVILAEPDAGYGVSEQQLVQTYNMFDIMLTTTQGEGFGLPTLEGMACGIPQIVPNWSALGTDGGWTGDDRDEFALHLPCVTTSITPNGVNVIGGVVDQHAVIEALDHLYRSPERRMRLSEAGLRLVAQPEFRWNAIGHAVDAVLESMIQEPVLT
jgi:D-inositol-3-phosphate glycosyltransferase